MAIHVADAAAPGARLALRAFKFHVLRGRPLLCRDEERPADAIETAAQQYYDLEPLLRRATAEAFGP